MSLDGIVRDGIIVPASPLMLPEGTRVRIEVAREPQAGNQQERQGGWWRGRVQIGADFDELPPDIASVFGADET